MSDDWQPIKQKKDKKKQIVNQINEEVFYLSDLLNDGACIRCINKSCKINQPHGIPFPDKLCVFVQKPTYIKGIEQLLNDAVIDFNGKKPFYTICNYINGNCKNCEDGRIKFVKYNDKSIALCYPNLENNKNKVTIGVHVDIELIIKGNQFNASIIPVEISFEEENNDCYLENSKETDEWPILNNINVVKKNDFSFLDVVKMHSKDEIIDSNNEITNNDNNIKNEENYIKNEENYIKNEENYIKNEENCINENINNIDYEYIDYLKRCLCELEDRNHFLEKEILVLTSKNSELFEKINTLERNIEYDKIVFKYGEKYDEILYNLNNLNNSISNQFFEENYSKYILL